MHEFGLHLQFRMTYELDSGQRRKRCVHDNKYTINATSAKIQTACKLCVTYFIWWALSAYGYVLIYVLYKHHSLILWCESFDT